MEHDAAGELEWRSVQNQEVDAIRDLDVPRRRCFGRPPRGDIQVGVGPRALGGSRAVHEGEARAGATQGGDDGFSCGCGHGGEDSARAREPSRARSPFSVPGAADAHGAARAPAAPAYPSPSTSRRNARTTGRRSSQGEVSARASSTSLVGPAWPEGIWVTRTGGDWLSSWKWYS